MKKEYFTPQQTYAMMDYTQLVKLWAQSKIFPRDMSKTQLAVIRNFCKKAIPWAQLTGTS